MKKFDKMSVEQLNDIVYVFTETIFTKYGNDMPENLSDSFMDRLKQAAAENNTEAMWGVMVESFAFGCLEGYRTAQTELTKNLKSALAAKDFDFEKLM
jgi:hypothetical protein